MSASRWSIRLRQSILWFAISVTTLTTTGCWDNHELEDLAFIDAIGVDEGPHENFEITYEIMNASTEAAIQGKRTPAGRPIYATVIAKNGIEGRVYTNISSDRLMTNSQEKILILGEKLLRKPHSLNLIEMLVREREFRRDLFVITSLDQVDSVLRSNDSKLATLPDRYLENMRRQHQFTATIPNSSLNDFLVAHEVGDWLPVMPLIGLQPKQSTLNNTVSREEMLPGRIPIRGGVNKIQMLGAEVFNYKGLATGRLSGPEVQIYLTMLGHVQTFIYSLPAHDVIDTVMLLRQDVQPMVHAKMQRGHLVFDVDIPFIATLLATNTTTDIVLNATETKQLEREVDKVLSQQTMALFKRTKKEFHGDLFQLSHNIKWRFLTEDAWRQFNWPKRYMSARLHVHYHVRITTFGKQRTPFRTLSGVK